VLDNSDDEKHDEVINLDSQPSNKESPSDLDDGKSQQVVDLCSETPVRVQSSRLNLDSFRFEEHCEGKGSSFSKQSAISMRSQSGKQIDIVRIDSERVDTDDEPEVS
jgi:hypothetical protein